MKNFHKLGVLLFAFLVLSSAAMGEERDIVLRGRSQVWVSKSIVTISDLMEFDVKSSASRESVIALGKMMVTSSPMPGAVKTLAGSEVVRVLSDAGVNLDRVGYVIPRSMTISRAARELTQDEARSAISRFLKKTEPETKVQRVLLPLRRDIFTGDVNFSIGTPEDRGANRIAFPLTVTSADSETMSLEVEAFLARFKDVPVAKHPLERGDTIEANDLVMARIDMSRVPADVVGSENSLIGLELMQPTSAGGFFRKRFVKISPVIKTGAPLTIRYIKGLLTATASGVAMEDGITGDFIRVRNESSRKILKARVISSGMVEVGLQ
jgi:flagella basal body P-ring formation protein FlgA